MLQALYIQCEPFANLNRYCIAIPIAKPLLGPTVVARRDQIGAEHGVEAECPQTAVV